MQKCLACRSGKIFITPWCVTCYRSLIPRRSQDFQLYYDRSSAAFIKGLKRGANWRMQKLAYRIFAKQLRRAELAPNTWICAMPTGAYGIQTQGLEIVARELAQDFSLQFKSKLLRKIVARKQSELGARSRLSAEVFLSLDPLQKNILESESPNVFILDDVLTTGTSLFQAEFLLKQAGARRVAQITLARRPLVGSISEKCTLLTL